MDALSYILDSVKLKAVVYQKISFTSAWGIEIAQDEYSQFWRLLKGTCYVKIPGEKIIKMTVGDLIFVPHGLTHTISAAPANICVPAAQYLKARQSANPMFQGNHEETLLIGGHFEFPSSGLHPFVKSLPKVIQIDNTNIEVSLWLQQVACFMNEEVVSGKLGAQVLLGRLAEVLFILIIRSYLERTDIEKGFLPALKE